MPPPPRRQWPPLYEGSSSQDNPLGIRVVPYSPPRPVDGEGPPEQGTGEQLSAYLAGNAFLAEDGATSAIQRRHGSSDLPGSTPSPSPPTLFGPLTTTRGMAVSDSSASFQPSATPSTSARPHSFYSSNFNDQFHPSQRDGQSNTWPNYRPQPRRRINIALNPDKTFSLVPQQQDDRGRGLLRSPQLSYSTTSVSSDPFTDEYPPSSPLTTLPEDDGGTPPARAIASSRASASTPRAAPAGALAPDHSPAPTSAPWNYRLSTGLRKVEQTPEPSLGKAPLPTSAHSSDSGSDVQTVSLPAAPAPQHFDSSPLSFDTPSTTSKPGNYQVYDPASPGEPTNDIPSSPSDEQNYHILDQTPTSSAYIGEPPTSPVSDSNYVAHGASSSSDDNYAVHGTSTASSEDNYAVHGTSTASSEDNYAAHGASPVSSDDNYVVHGTSTHGASTPASNVNYVVHGGSTPASDANYILHGTSTHGASTPASDANYDFHGASTPVSDANYIIHGTSTHGESTPASEANYIVHGTSTHGASTPASDANYVVHGASSPVSSSPVPAIRGAVREEYSQESLVVQPLQLRHKASAERVGYYKALSRENLRRATSLKSISSVLSQEATQSVLLAAPTAAYLQGGPQGFSNMLHDKRSKNSPGPSSTLVTPHMNPHPHQWSSQLSTVASESEGGSVPGSRSLSLVSYQTRRSSGVLPANHSRNMLSISSSNDERSMSHTRSLSDSADRSQPTLTRPSQRDLHEIRDPDEHGDGLTDLYALHQRPSRTRLSGLFSIPSDRSLHSPSSSRANSLTSLSLSLPGWARLYYGSGERKLLTFASESNLSEASGARPGSPFQSVSPEAEHSTSPIYNQVQRPRQASQRSSRAPSHQEPPPNPEEIRPDDLRVGFVRRQTSSVWSPHLRQDRRASRYSNWEPPPETGSSNGPLLERRNVQVALFTVGFIFPLGKLTRCLCYEASILLALACLKTDTRDTAWIIAACLPVPSNPKPDMEKGDGAASQHDTHASAAHRRSAMAEAPHHEGARWWRRLNRYMSVVGLLVIGAVIALVVVGVRQRWGS